MSFVVALLTAATSGFIALSYELLWYRAYGFVSQGAPYTFGYLLGSYLLGIALGSLVSRWFCRDGATGDRGQMARVSAFVYLANLASFLVVPGLAWVTVRQPWTRSLPLVSLGAGLLGATLPLVSHFGIAPDERVGQRLSYVYLANIVGSAAGSLITGFVFLDLWPLATIARLLGALGVAMALALFVVSRPRPAALASAAALSLATAWAVLSPGKALFDQLYEKLYFKRQFTADKEFSETLENRHGVINVYQGMVYGSGAYDGIFNVGLRHDPNWVFRAYAIGALHPEPRRVLMIGLASGSWAQIIAHLPGLEKLTVVEINPGYLDLMKNHDEVRSVLTDPKVEIVIDDGRRWLQRHPDARFDVIVMNTTWHWRAHATNLLSADFLRMLKAHLAPGGMVHYNSTSSDDVMITACDVFPHVLRMYNFLSASDAPVVFDKGRWRKTLLDYRIEGRPILDPGDPGDQKRLDELLALPDLIHGPPVEEGLETRESMVARLKTARVITDDNMVSEWFSTEAPEP